MSFRVNSYKNSSTYIGGEFDGGVFHMTLHSIDHHGAFSGVHQFTELERERLERYVNVALNGCQLILEKVNKRIAEEGAWVDALTHEPYSVGDKVHYLPDHYSLIQAENGIVKEVRPGDDGCFVVYNCNHEWHRYYDYTAAKTNYRDLKPGWK